MPLTTISIRGLGATIPAMAPRPQMNATILESIYRQMLEGYLTAPISEVTKAIQTFTQNLRRGSWIREQTQTQIGQLLGKNYSRVKAFYSALLRGMESIEYQRKREPQMPSVSVPSPAPPSIPPLPSMPAYELPSAPEIAPALQTKEALYLNILNEAIDYYLNVQKYRVRPQYVWYIDRNMYNRFIQEIARRANANGAQHGFTYHITVAEDAFQRRGYEPSDDRRPADVIVLPSPYDNPAFIIPTGAVHVRRPGEPRTTIITLPGVTRPSVPQIPEIPVIAPQSPPSAPQPIAPSIPQIPAIPEIPVIPDISISVPEMPKQPVRRPEIPTYTPPPSGIETVGPKFLDSRGRPMATGYIPFKLIPYTWLNSRIAKSGKSAAELRGLIANALTAGFKRRSMDISATLQWRASAEAEPQKLYTMYYDPLFDGAMEYVKKNGRDFNISESDWQSIIMDSLAYLWIFRQGFASYEIPDREAKNPYAVDIVYHQAFEIQPTTPKPEHHITIPSVTAHVVPHTAIAQASFINLAPSRDRTLYLEILNDAIDYVLTQQGYNPRPINYRGVDVTRRARIVSYIRNRLSGVMNQYHMKKLGFVYDQRMIDEALKLRGYVNSNERTLLGNMVARSPYEAIISASLSAQRTALGRPNAGLYLSQIPPAREYEYTMMLKQAIDTALRGYGHETQPIYRQYLHPDRYKAVIQSIVNYSNREGYAKYGFSYSVPLIEDALLWRGYASGDLPDTPYKVQAAPSPYDPSNFPVPTARKATEPICLPGIVSQAQPSQVTTPGIWTPAEPPPPLPF